MSRFTYGIFLFQCTEVKSSYHMELEGLSRTIDAVEAYLPHLHVRLNTDGHPSVEKWLREEKKETNHPLL
jgi:hypothetical protein